MHSTNLLLEEPIRMASILEPSNVSFFLTMTKIVGTLGPKSHSVDTISSYLKAGMPVARFDFSWGDAEYHQENLENLKLAIKSTKKLCTDEGMHSSADVEAFTEALNREVEGNGSGNSSAATAFSSQSQPLDHGVACTGVMEAMKFANQELGYELQHVNMLITFCNTKDAPSEDIPTSELAKKVAKMQEATISSSHSDKACCHSIADILLLP